MPTRSITTVCYSNLVYLNYVLKFLAKTGIISIELDYKLFSLDISHA